MLSPQGNVGPLCTDTWVQKAIASCFVLVTVIWCLCQPWGKSWSWEPGPGWGVLLSPSWGAWESPLLQGQMPPGKVLV